MKKKHLYCLALAVCILLCASGCASWAEKYDGGASPSLSVAYIPLDDRPVNTQRAELLAQSAGVHLLMPDESLYRTALDGQPPNPNGTSCGDGAALLEWLRDCDADYYALSLDQLLSGGLVNSRSMTEIGGEYLIIDELFSLLEGKKALLFDTVMRLSPTVGYLGCTLEDYLALRDYGALPRPELSGDADAQSIIAAYAVESDTDSALTEPYLAARSRKLRLTEHILSAMPNDPNIRIFYGIDDSHEGNTVQSNEVSFIRHRLKNGEVFSGADELGLMAIASAIRLHYGDAPSVDVKYFGADPQAPADIYDSGTLGESIASHISALGAELVDSSPELELLVFGDGAADALLARYEENAASGLPTVIIDISRGTSLPSAMLGDGDLDTSILLGYSAWNTAGNSVGIALSCGIARYLYLKHAKEPIAGADRGFAVGLALGFAKDIAYASAKNGIDALVTERGGDIGNFFGMIDENELRSAALGLINDTASPSFDRISGFLQGKRFLSSLSPIASEPFPELYIADISFPWQRTFEAEIRIEIKT